MEAVTRKQSADAAEAVKERARNRKYGAAFYLLLAMTLLRIPLAVVFALVLFGISSPMDVLAGTTRVLGYDQLSVGLVWVFMAILALIELTDYLDGYIARRFNLVTLEGKILDPLADSISRITIYWALACTGLVMPAVPLVMALRDLTGAYCKVMLASSQQNVAARWSGKLKAGIIGGAAFLLVIGPIYRELFGLGIWTYYFISWVVIAVVVASLYEYVRAAVKATYGK